MITEHEADIASAGLEVMIHAAERFTEVLLLHYEQKVRERDEYKALVKHYGKAYADDYLRQANRRVLLQDEKMKLGNWLRAANALLKQTEICTTIGITEAKKDDSISASDMFESLLGDANMMCRLFCYYGNIPPEEHMKMESTLKLMGKRTDVPMDFINANFKMQ